MPAAHTERRGDLPFARWDRIRGRLSPRSLCYSPAVDCRKGNEPTIPDLEETLCGLFKQPPWRVRERQWLRLLGAAANGARDPREPFLGLKNNAAQLLRQSSAVCGQPVGPGLPTHWSRWI